MSIESSMRTYHFRAGAPDGGVFAGRLQAASEADALHQLISAGNVPIRLETGPLRTTILDREVTLGRSKVLTLRDCETFCRELSITLGAGFELTEAMSVMISSLPKRSRLRGYCVAARQGLRMGRSLSQAIVETGYILPREMVPVIRAGEQTASLAACLGTLCEACRESGKFRGLLVGALLYPAFLVVVAAAVVGIIAIYVTPTLAGLFESMDRPVPGILAILDTAGRLLGDNIVASGLGVMAAVCAAGALSAKQTVRQAFQTLAFVLPVVGGVMAWSATRRFATTLGLYAENNVPLANAATSAFEAAGFPRGARRAAKLNDAIRRGVRLADALEALGSFPPKVVHLIRVGESSGRLPQVLTAIVEEAKVKLEGRLLLVSALLAPVLIVLVGAVIGGIIFSVFSALLEINNLVV